MPSADFEYSPLTGGRHIRLAKIQPGGSKDIISVSLRAVDLDDKPSFTALSYTCRKQRRGYQLGLDIAKETLTRSWKQKKFEFALPDGKPVVEYTEPILCNGGHFLVAPALHEVLKYFREKGSTREYWIDAICMHQSDADEKSSQVKLMSSIYASANLVFVWLGSHARGRRGIPGLEKMAQSLTDDQLPPFRFNSTDKEELALLIETAESLELSGGSRDPLIFESFLTLELTQRLWFTRIWVLQEYLLARKVVFYYADTQLSNEAIRKAFVWSYTNTSADKLQDSAASSFFGLGATFWSSHGLDFSFLAEARKAVLRGRNLTLEEWIRICRGRQAGDPRDFVFAGLSLLGRDCVWIDRDALQLGCFEESPPALPPRPGTNDSIAATACRGSHKKSTTLLPNGLWAKLEPHYKASEAEVFVNLAACILSKGPHQVSRLLSLASRPINGWDMKEFESLRPTSSTFDGGIPSWAPVLGSWTARINSDLMSARPEAGGGADTFAAATLDSSDAQTLPQISRDGRTLCLNVIPLDVVNKEGRTETGNNIFNIDEWSTGVEFITFLLQLPETMSDEGRTSFDAAATSLAACLPSKPNAIGIADRVVPVGDEHNLLPDAHLTPEHLPRLWLCELLDRAVQNWVSSTQWEIAAAEKAKEREDLVTRLADIQSLYLQLATRYNDLPWSGTQGLKNKAIDTNTSLLDSQQTQRVSPGAREYQKALGREIMGFRVLFVTEDGRTGIGPVWLRAKDRLMLVQGAAVPYLFRHVSDVDLREVIRQTAVSLQEVEENIAESQAKDLAKATKKPQNEARESQTTHELRKKASGLRAKIREHESQIGRDAWFLVGEVYVDGIMHGEAMTRAGVDAFERISIV